MQTSLDFLSSSIRAQVWKQKTQTRIPKTIDTRINVSVFPIIQQKELEGRKKNYPYQKYDIISHIKDILDMHIFYLYLKRTFHLVFGFVVVILIIRTFILEPGRVNGRSMENTFVDNDFFLLNKTALLVRAPKRGDIVQAHPNNDETNVIKRIVGLPGEVISIHGGYVYLVDKNGNETKLDEPYVKPGVLTEVPNNIKYTTRPIPANTFFIMGDNRSMSIDSRTYGSVHRAQIYGVVMAFPWLRK